MNRIFQKVARLLILSEYWKCYVFSYSDMDSHPVMLQCSDSVVFPRKFLFSV